MRALCVWVLIGCGSGGSGSGALDCAYITSAQSCWKLQLANIHSCTVPALMSGQMSADRKTCTYTDGHQILFDAALALPINGGVEYHFTVKNGAADCVRFDESAAGDDLKLTTSLGMLRLQRTSSTTVTLTCPDGSQRSTSNGQALLGCPRDGTFLFDLPGQVVYQNSGSSGGIDLGGEGEIKQVTLFDCSFQ